jgi:tetratricopeptide (TPR) repeat protein
VIGKSVGERLRALRRQRDMTVQQVAGAGLPEEEVEAIERDARAPDAAELRTLAERLGCSLAFMAHGITDRQVAGLRARMDRAEAALHAGAVQEAGQEFARLGAEPALGFLPDLRRRVGYGSALALEAVGNRSAAIEQLETLLEEACSVRAETAAVLADAEVEFREQRISIALALCRCHREMGELQAAVRVGEEALDREEPLGWTDRLVELASTLLAAYIERGDRERMTQFATQLLEEADRIRSPRAIVAASWNSAMVSYILGDPLEADHLSNRAIRLQATLDDPLKVGRLRMCMAVHALLHAVDDIDIEKVDRMLTQAHAELVAASAHPGDIASCLLSLARVDLLRGRPERALDRGLKTVERLAGVVGPVAVEAHQLLAQVYQALGRLEEAVVAQTGAARELERMKALRRASEAWMAVADLYDGAGQPDQRHAALRQALECAAL